MHKNTKKIWLRYVIAPLALLVLLYLIYRQVTARGDIKEQWQRLREHLNTGNIKWFVLVMLLAPANWVLEALKWQKLLSRIRPVVFKQAFKSMLSGMSFSLVTPNRVGDFAGRIIHVGQGYKIKAAFASVIGSVAQMCITASFGIAGLIYLNVVSGNFYTKLALGLAFLIAGGALFLFFNINRFKGFGKRYKQLRKLNFGLRVFSFYSKRDLAYILLLAFGRFLCYNLQFLLLINILGAGVPLFPGILVSALMFWTISVVPSVAMLELGVRGFVGIYLFMDATQLSTESLALLSGSYLLWFINLVVPAILGSFTLLRLKTES
ncbi:MAG: flippase-like domain-containing protein [Taibaiella sp.]|nr:flippase-like domain-containing protein [Taibaiella sp.]